MYYVYLLKSLKNGTFYIGFTRNIESRLNEHNNGRVKYSSRNKPYVLIGFEEFESMSKARWREYMLKRSAWQRKKFIGNLSMTR